MDLTPQQIAAICRRVRKEAKQRASAPDPTWPARFRELEQKLARAKPHLLEQKHCGLCPDTDDRPRRKVKLPNGQVIFSTWYKVPTTDADATRARKETAWLNEQGKLKRAGLPHCYPF